MSDKHPLASKRTYLGGFAGAVLSAAATVGIPHIPVPKHTHPEYDRVEPPAQPVDHSELLVNLADQVTAHIDERVLITCRQ